ncbi:MAG: hypothetical protein V1915_04650 [Candidatus Bathyarchaeota archaeon]
MTEMLEEATFNLLYSDIRETGLLTNEQKLKLEKLFGSRFVAASKAIEELKVKKYVFTPSGRVIWIVTGKERDYQILPLANFCSCFDFYFRVIDRETSFCYHLIAQKLSEALQKYVIVEEHDTMLVPLIEKWGETIERKREFSITQIENIRRIAIEVISEENEITIKRLISEIRETGFVLTPIHLANILKSDKEKRFNHINGLWTLDSVNIK